MGIPRRTKQAFQHSPKNQAPKAPPYPKRGISAFIALAVALALIALTLPATMVAQVRDAQAAVPQNTGNPFENGDFTWDINTQTYKISGLTIKVGNLSRVGDSYRPDASTYPQCLTTAYENWTSTSGNGGNFAGWGLGRDFVYGYTNVTKNTRNIQFSTLPVTGHCAQRTNDVDPNLYNLERDARLILIEEKSYWEGGVYHACFGMLVENAHDVGVYDQATLALYVYADWQSYGWAELTKASANEDISNNNNLYSLAGAEYGIFQDEACTNKAATLITDSNGKATSGDLLPGSYWVKETKASAGYALDETIYPLTITAGETTPINNGRVSEVPQNNPLDLLLFKYDRDYTNNKDGNTAQGAATLAGAQFSVSHFPAGSATGTPARTWVFQTDAQGKIYFDSSYLVKGDSLYYNSEGKPTLPLGTYVIRETKAPEGYLLNSDPITCSIEAGGTSETLNSYQVPAFSNTVMRGGLTVEKRDLESKLQTPLGAAKLDGTLFEVRTLNEQAVYVNEVWYAKGEVVATLSISNGAASLPADTLPYGTYSVQEAQAGTGYHLSDGDARTFTITKEGQVCEFTGDTAFYNQVKRGDIKLIKARESDMARLAKVVFRITSETTGESHIAVTDENGKLATASSHAKHSYQTNANDAYVSEDGTVDETLLNPEAGIWFGLTADGWITEVNDSLGALPFDTYTIEELRSSANEGLQLMKLEHVSVRRDGEESDLGTIDNRSDQKPSIATSASDTTDGDKVIAADNDAVIVDHVEYMNLTANEEYTLQATLLDKTSGEMIEGATGATTFIATAANGYAEVQIPVSLAGATGDSVVVYETLTHEGQTLVEHTDPNNSEQTLRLAKPKISTSAADGADGDNTITASPEVCVIDTVSYTKLVAGKEYTVSGALHLKNEDGSDAGVLLDASGNEVRASTTFVPDTENGQVELRFTFDASLLSGRQLVAFEELMRNGALVASHADISATEQTVQVEPLIIGTQALDGLDRDNLVSAGNAAHIVDIVALENAVAGRTYTAFGLIMDAETQLPLVLGQGEYDEAELKALTQELYGILGITNSTTDAAENTSDGSAGEGAGGADASEGANESSTGEQALSHDPSLAIDLSSFAQVLDAYPHFAERLAFATQEVTLQEASGAFEMDFSLDCSALTGKKAVCFEMLIDNNRAIASHLDFTSEEQTVEIVAPSIKTELTEKTSGTHTFTASSNTQLIDLVSYENLTPGETYTFALTLIDAASGTPLETSQGTASATTTLAISEARGTVEVPITFDSSALEDGSVVVAFERVYQQGSDIPLATHEDLEDESQACIASVPSEAAPEGSAATTTPSATAGLVKTGEPLLLAAYVVAISALAGVITLIVRRPAAREALRALIRARL